MSTTLLTDLPSEILSHILSFVSHADVRDARLTCKKLYSASLAYNLIDRERVDYGGNHSDLQRALLKSTRYFLHFRFDCVAAFSYNANLWSQFGPKLKSLEFNKCTITEEQLFSVLAHCASLKYLRLWVCRIQLSPETKAEPYDYDKLTFHKDPFPQLGLEKLCLNIIDVRLFWKILKCSRNLHSLSLQGFKAKRWYEDGSGTHEYERSAYVPLTVDDVFLYLNIRGSQIRSLALDCDDSWVFELDYQVHYDDPVDSFRDCLLKADPLLQPEEYLPYVKLSEKILMNHKNCQRLKLIEATPDLVNFTCRELQNLTHLEIQPFLDSETDYRQLASLKKLVSLNMELNNLLIVVDSDVLQGLLCGQINTVLKDLEIRYICGNILLTPECVNGLSRTYPALTRLKLHDCDGVTDVSVQSIFRHLVSLETLELIRCKNLTDAGLSGSVIDEIASDIATSYSIARLKKLRHLDLSGCVELTGKAFAKEMYFPDLRFLSLRTMIRVFCDSSQRTGLLWSDETLVSCTNLIPFIKNNPTIESLHLDRAAQFTDEFVSVLLNNLWRLRDISIGDSSELSDESMRLLMKHCKRVENLPY